MAVQATSTGMPLDANSPNWDQCADFKVPKLEQDTTINHFLFVDHRDHTTTPAAHNEHLTDIPSFADSTSFDINKPSCDTIPRGTIDSLIDSISHLTTLGQSDLRQISFNENYQPTSNLNEPQFPTRTHDTNKKNKYSYQIGWISKSEHRTHTPRPLHPSLPARYEGASGITENEYDGMLHPALHRKKSRQSLRQDANGNETPNTTRVQSLHEPPPVSAVLSSPRGSDGSTIVEARNSSSLISLMSALPEHPVSVKHKFTLPRSRSSLGLKKDVADHIVPSTNPARSQDPRPGEAAPSVLKVVSSLSPSSRDDLGEHLIPSRRSSMGPSRASRGSEEQKRPSADVELDPELLEENNATVRRIRELQEAREQRQKEWRREARRSEKAARRLSLPSTKSNQDSPSLRGSRHSIVDTLPETAEQEETPVILANTKGTDPISVVYRLDPVKTPATHDHSDTPKSTVNERPRQQNRSSTTGLLDKSIFPSEVKTVSRSASSPMGIPTTSQKSVAQEVENFLAAPRLTRKIKHPRTGRLIAFSDVGDPNGFPVICCVGMGLTRYLTLFYDELATTLKLRLITPDRPGVGASDPCPDGGNTPLGWVDDAAVICNELGISRFSLLAHSAGAIYAMAIALKMPQFVRGRIHLLAPWIPPSQMLTASVWGSGAQANLPLSHRLLSVLPSQFLKAANSRFLSSTSAGLDHKTRRMQKNSSMVDLESSILYDDLSSSTSMLSLTLNEDTQPGGHLHRPAQERSCYQTNNSTLVSQGVLRPPPSRQTSTYGTSIASSQRPNSAARHNPTMLSSEERKKAFNTALTHRIWQLATLNANPAGDLLVCLERRKPIGFRYAEITRSIVIHHGSKDGRVPIDNVRWLVSVMRRCELRVLENEGHGLMANAGVMAGVLGEIGREWDEWDRIARNKQKSRKHEHESLRDTDMHAGGDSHDV